MYAGSDDPAEVGWYDDSRTEYDEDGNEVEIAASIDCPQPVAGKCPTRWGLYDLSGNVCEWCWDVIDYPIGAVTDPTGAPSGPRRVYRGGAWDNTADLARASSRFRDAPSDRYDYLGFRLSRTIA